MAMNRFSRLVLPGLLLAAAYYAVFGGEYSMFELRRTRVDLESERLTLVDLQAQIDSMSAWADSLSNDPLTIERVARERFGMIREGETLYRFAVPDSSDLEGGDR
jgi:cell division protein FtsB